MVGYLPPGLSLDRQFAMLKLRHPSGDGYVRKGKLAWTWAIQPTPISRRYTAKMEYVRYDSPKVYVDHQIRTLAGTRKIPHLYDQEKLRLCLYLPGSGEWTSHKLLADTLIPWTSLWLFYFEEWLLSNEWKGGGKHPGENSEFIENSKELENLY